MNIQPRVFRFLKKGDRTTHDEKFFELFDLAMYICVDVFSNIFLYTI